MGILHRRLDRRVVGFSGHQPIWSFLQVSRAALAVGHVGLPPAIADFGLYIAKDVCIPSQYQAVGVRSEAINHVNDSLTLLNLPLHDIILPRLIERWLHVEGR
jgi:hypothetical protein